MPWHTCDVVRTGPAEDGTIFIRLRDVGGAFPSRWFPAAGPTKREMLATALTAITTGLHVNAFLTSTTEYQGVVNRLYLSRED
jgi:hypothetical protein